MKNLILFLFIVLLASCSKSNNEFPVIPEGIYQTGNTVYTRPVVMYVQNRLITDTGIINPFLRFYNYTNYFTTNSSYTITDTLLKIQIFNNDSVRMRIGPVDTFCSGHTNRFSPSELVISKDDSYSLRLSNVFGRGTRCDSIEKKISKFPWHIEETIISGFPDIILTVWQKFPLLFVNGELELPVLSRAVASANASGIRCSAAVNTWGIDNTGLENILGNSDTIVVQVRTLKLNRQ
jgi:hypothetical protein